MRSSLGRPRAPRGRGPWARSETRWAAGRGVRGRGDPAANRGFGRTSDLCVDRSCVLLWLIGVALGQSDERPDGGTLRPLRSVRSVAFEPEGAGDIHVCPFGPVFDGRLEERRGGDSSTCPGACAVSDIGDLSFDVVAVLIGERHRPPPIACRPSCRSGKIDAGIGPFEQIAEVLY